MVNIFREIKSSLQTFWLTSDRKEKAMLLFGIIAVSVLCISWVTCALYIGIDYVLRGGR